MHIEFFYFREVVVILLAAVISTVTFTKMNISTILGYFVSGALIGKYGFGLVGNSSIMDYIAQFGVVFLLFSIGLELTLQRLLSMKTYVFGFGILQLVITSIIVYAISVYTNINSAGAIVISLGVAISSTVVVIQLLKENGIQISQVGRLSISVLLMQDFAVVPMLIFVSLLGEAKSGQVKTAFLTVIGSALAKAFITLILIFVIGRLVIKPLFDSIKSLNSEEVFISTVLLIVLGLAFTTEYFGLSMALGAFIAGLLVAETDYKEEVEITVLPFKNLLLGLFFMTVGMSINYKTLLDNIGIIIILASSIILLKTAIIYLLCRLFKIPRSSALQSGLILSQVGEFAFVIFTLAVKSKIIEPNSAEILMIITTVTMGSTSILNRLYNMLSHKYIKSKSDNSSLSEDTYDMSNHIILIGFGRAGQASAKALSNESQQYVALEINKELIQNKKTQGIPIHFGNATKKEVLLDANIQSAKCIIIAISNDISIKKIISTVSEQFPHIIIITRAEDVKLAHIYHSCGAHLTIPEKQELGISLGVAGLNACGISSKAAKASGDRLRKLLRYGEL